MTRIIKFRALSEDGTRYFGGEDSETISDFFAGFEPSRVENDPHSILRWETLEMFTGLTDKNGEEIWQGDILEYKSNQRELSTVFFDEGSFKITQPSSRCTRTLGHHLTKYQCKVIGDIQLNPELLN